MAGKSIMQMMVECFSLSLPVVVDLDYVYLPNLVVLLMTFSLHRQ